MFRSRTEQSDNTTHIYTLKQQTEGALDRQTWVFFIRCLRLGVVNWGWRSKGERKSAKLCRTKFILRNHFELGLFSLFPFFILFRSFIHYQSDKRLHLWASQLIFLHHFSSIIWRKTNFVDEVQTACEDLMWKRMLVVGDCNWVSGFDFAGKTVKNCSFTELCTRQMKMPSMCRFVRYRSTFALDISRYYGNWYVGVWPKTFDLKIWKKV
jgi:hypothetical protein